MIVARMRAKDKCGAKCPEWIVAQGVITPNTPARFRQALDAMGREKLPVILDSPGGDLDAALAIGRMIRTEGLTTAVGRSEAQGCAPRDDSCKDSRPQEAPYAGFVTWPADCAGACLLVLSGGVKRAGYWITQAALPSPDTFKSRTVGADPATLIGAYFAEMGISPGLMPRIRRSSLPLDRDDMLHFGLSTGRDRVEDLTGASICMGASPAPNCVADAVPPPRVSASPARQPEQRTGRVIIWGGLEDM